MEKELSNLKFNGEDVAPMEESFEDLLEETLKGLQVEHEAYQDVTSGPEAYQDVSSGPEAYQDVSSGHETADASNRKNRRGAGISMPKLLLMPADDLKTIQKDAPLAHVRKRPSPLFESNFLEVPESIELGGIEGHRITVHDRAISPNLVKLRDRVSKRVNYLDLGQ